MTPQEHGLMLAIFTRQAMLIKALADVMRSRGIIEFDDVALSILSFPNKRFWLLPVGLRTAHLYQEVAQSLGVETGLEIPLFFGLTLNFLCVLFSFVNRLGDGL